MMERSADVARRPPILWWGGMWASSAMGASGSKGRRIDTEEESRRVPRFRGQGVENWKEPPVGGIDVGEGCDWAVDAARMAAPSDRTSLPMFRHTPG